MLKYHKSIYWLQKTSLSMYLAPNDMLLKLLSLVKVTI